MSPDTYGIATRSSGQTIAVSVHKPGSSYRNSDSDLHVSYD